MGCPAIMQWQPLLLVLLLLLVSTHQRMQASEEVTLSISTKKAVHVCSQKFLSITVDPASLLFGPELGSRAETALAMARELSPAYLRLAGHCTNRLSFQKDDLPEEPADNYTITERQWESVAGFAQRAGLRLVVALPSQPRDGLDWDPRPAVEFIAFCDRLRLPVAAWQLGYELQYERATAWQLGRDVQRLRRLLDAFPRYAGSLLVAPDVVRFRERTDAEWLRSFLESAGSALSALTWHPHFVARIGDVHGYQEGQEDAEYKEDDTEGELYFPPDSIVWDREALNKALGRQGARLPLWIAESHSGESRGWFVDALQWAHKLGVATRSDASVIFRQPDPRAFSTPTPEFWVSVLHKRLVGRTVLETRLAGNRSHVHAFSACARPGSIPHAEGGVAVWAVNLLARRVRLSIKASWGHPDKVHVLQYSLTAAGPHPLHSRKVLLNGEPLTLLPNGEVPELQPRERLLGRTPVLPLPARSVTFLVFPEASVRLCQEEVAAAGPHYAVRHRSAEEEEEQEEEDDDDYGEEAASDEEEGDPEGAAATRDKRKLSAKHHIVDQVEHELKLKAKIPKEKAKLQLEKKKIRAKSKILKEKVREELVHKEQEEALTHLEEKKWAKAGLKKHLLEDEKKKLRLKPHLERKEKEHLLDRKLKHAEIEKRKRLHKAHEKQALVRPIHEKKRLLAKQAVLATEHHQHEDLEHKLKQAELHHALEEAAHHNEHKLKQAELHHALGEVALLSKQKLHKAEKHHALGEVALLSKHKLHEAEKHHALGEVALLNKHKLHEAEKHHALGEAIHHKEHLRHEPILKHAVVHPIIEKKHHIAEEAVLLAPIHHEHKELEHKVHHALEEVAYHEPIVEEKEHHHIHVGHKLEPLHHHDKWRNYREIDSNYQDEDLADDHDLVRHRKQAPKHYSTGDAPSWEEDGETAHYDYRDSPYKSNLKYLKKKYGYKDKSHVSEQKPRNYKYSASPQSLHKYSDEDTRKDHYVKRKYYSRKGSPATSEIPPESSYSETIDGERHASTVGSSDRQFTETEDTQEYGTSTQKIKHKFKPFEDFEDTTTSQYSKTTQAEKKTHDDGVSIEANGDNKTVDHFQAVNTYPWYMYKSYSSPNIHVIYQNTTTTSTPPATHGSISPPENITETSAIVVDSTTTETPYVSQDQKHLSSTVGSATSEPHVVSTSPRSEEQLSLIQVLDESPDQKSNERIARVRRHAPDSGPYVIPRPAHELGQTFAKTKSSLRRRKEEEMRLLKRKKKLRESMRANRRKDDSGAHGQSFMYDPNASVSYEDVDYLFGVAKHPEKDDSFPRGDVYLKEGKSSEEKDEDYDYVEPESSEDGLGEQLTQSKKKANPVVSIEDNDIEDPGYWQFFEDIKVPTPRKKSKYSQFGELWEAESHSDPTLWLEAEPEEDEGVKVVQETVPPPEQDSKTKSTVAKILKMYFDKTQHMSNEKEMEDEYRKRKQKKKHYTNSDVSEGDEERDLARISDYFEIDNIDENVPPEESSGETDGDTPQYASSGRAKSTYGRDKRSVTEPQLSLATRSQNDAKQRPKLSEKELEKMVDKIVAAVNKLDEESKAKLITLDIDSGEGQQVSHSPTDATETASYGSPGKRRRRSAASGGYDHEMISKVRSERNSKVPEAKNQLNKKNGPHEVAEKGDLKESLTEKGVSAMSPASSLRTASKTSTLNDITGNGSHKNYEASSKHHLQSQFSRNQQNKKKSGNWYHTRDSEKLKGGKHGEYNRNSDISFTNSKRAATMNTEKLSEIIKFNSKGNLDRHAYVVQPHSHSPENSVKKDLKASYRVPLTKLKEPSTSTRETAGKQRAPDTEASADRGHEFHKNPGHHKDSSESKSENGFNKKVASQSPKKFPNAHMSGNAIDQHPHIRQRRSAFDTKMEEVPADQVETPIAGSAALHRNLVGESGLLGETVYWEDGYRGSPSDLRFITDQAGPQLKFSGTERDMALWDKHSAPIESSSGTDAYHHETTNSDHPKVAAGASFVFEYVGEDDGLAVPLHDRVYPPEVAEGHTLHYQTNDFLIPDSMDTIILPEELEPVEHDFILPRENLKNDNFYYNTGSKVNINRIIVDHDPSSESESATHIATVGSSQHDQITKNGYPFKYTESISGSDEYHILGVDDEVQNELNRILGGIKNVVIAQRTSFEPIDDYFEDHLRMHSNDKKANRHKRSVSEEDEDEEQQNTDDEIVEKRPYKLDSRMHFVNDDEEEDSATFELSPNDSISMNEIDDDDLELIQRNLIRIPSTRKQTLFDYGKGSKPTKISSSQSTSRGSQHKSKTKIPSEHSDLQSHLDEAVSGIKAEEASLGDQEGASPNLDSDRYEQSSSHISDADEKLIDKSRVPMLDISPQGSGMTNNVSDGSTRKTILDPASANTGGAEKDSKGEMLSRTHSSDNSAPSSDETVSTIHDDKKDSSSDQNTQETQKEEKKSFFQRMMAKINSAFRVMGSWMFLHKRQPSPSS